VHWTEPLFFVASNRHLDQQPGILCLTAVYTVGSHNKELSQTQDLGASCSFVLHAKSGGNSGGPSENQSYFAHALFDFRRSVWLRPKATAKVVQCCKNCLLVLFTVCSLQSVHGVGVIHGAFSRADMERDATQG